MKNTNNMFLVCFTEDIKNKLLQEGYKLISENGIEGNKTYTFENSKKLVFSDISTKLNFSNTDIMFTNKLMF